MTITMMLVPAEWERPRSDGSELSDSRRRPARGRVDPRELRVGQLEVDRTDVLRELLGRPRADDRDAGKAVLLHEPAQRHLCRRGVDLLGDALDGLEDVPRGVAGVAVLEEIGQTPASAVGRDHGAVVGPLVFPGEEAAGQRRVRTDRDVLIRTDLEIVAHVVRIGRVEHRLGHVEPLEALDIAGPQRLRELPGGHARGPEIVDFPLADEFGERPHRLLDRRVLVPAVDVVQIEVVGAQSLEGPLDLARMCLRPRPESFGPGSPRPSNGK